MLGCTQVKGIQRQKQTTVAAPALVPTHTFVLFVAVASQNVSERCVHQGTALDGLEGLQALLQGLDRVRPQIDHTLPSGLQKEKKLPVAGLRFDDGSL